MSKFTVTVVDTTQIQNYVFGSNRLQENIGASELVWRATKEWALQAVREVTPKNNVDEKTLEVTNGFQIDAPNEDNAAEVIYVGGGNTVVIFSRAETARSFARELTRKVLLGATGLSLVVAHDDDFHWPPADNGSERAKRGLATVVSELLGKTLAERKAARLSSTPLLGLGVTASCESTGLAAVRTNEGEFNSFSKHPAICERLPKEEKRSYRLKLDDEEKTRLISREVACKLWARDLAQQRLKGMFAEQLVNWYDFPSDMDKLGRIKGEESYVAVVHADGNGMGKRIEAIAYRYKDPAQNRKYIEVMREFSQQVEDAARAALHHIVRLLTRRITWEQGKEYIAGRVPMEKTWLPFRPLVFGGDDVTFVCNGQLGVSLAVEFLKAFEQEADKANSKDVNGLRASAGIAIVKMRYPFARAYALSTELAGSAKDHVWKETGGTQTSALDWHISMTGLSGSLNAIRWREYEKLKDPGDKENVRTLLLRPLLLHADEGKQDGRAWCEQVEWLIQQFQDKEAWPGSKVKMLRERLREGLGGNFTAIATFLHNTGLELPAIGTVTRYKQEGWSLLSEADGKSIDRCGYFDAIELCDHYLHLPLPTDTEDNNQEAQ